MQYRKFLATTLAALMLGALGAGSHVASAQTGGANAVDPVVADVVRMLGAGVESELVLQWLEASGRRPAPLSADDIIALSQAEAPKEIIQALLDLSARPAPPPPPVPPPQTRSQPAAPPAAAPPVAGVAAAPGSDECCLVELSVEYRAPREIEGDNTIMPEHDLFVYVDGTFLARISPDGNLASRGPVRLKTRLDPGLHRVRLTRELHRLTDDFGKAPAWTHETTVSPVPMDIEVVAGGSYNLDLRWIEGEWSLKKPLSWRWSRNGDEVAGEQHTGKFSEDWAWLCEDVEASRDSGAIAQWRARDRLDGCVRWSELWPAPLATSRAQVLADLQRHDFNPPASYVGRLD